MSSRFSQGSEDSISDSNRPKSELLVTPENLPTNRARLMHQGRAIYSPEASVRNHTLAARASTRSEEEG